MTELPPSKQRLADQLSGIRGMGKGVNPVTRTTLTLGRPPLSSSSHLIATDFKTWAWDRRQVFPRSQGFADQFRRRPH